ncbi:hypothetical protein D3C81_442100 [compost metagenome]
MRTDPRKACANQEEKLSWALVHDGIAHPLMALTLFSKLAVAFHDWTSQKAWPRKTRKRGQLTRSLDFDSIDRLSKDLHAQHIPHSVKSTPCYANDGSKYFEYDLEVLV